MCGLPDTGDEQVFGEATSLDVQLELFRNGELLHSAMPEFSRNTNRIPVGLREGHYRVQCISAWGTRGEATFDVPPGEDPAAPPVEIPILIR